MSSSTADVFLNKSLVGNLGVLADGRVAFRFSNGYRELLNRPVLGQRFEDDLEKTYVGKHPGELPAFFANVLPEGRLRSVLESSLGQGNLTDLQLLVAVGTDLPGALRVVRSAHDFSPPLPAPSRENPQGNGEELGLKFSLAGVQLKFSVINQKDRFTVPAADATGDWILKVSLQDFVGLPENEYSILEWARKMQFEVPECRLVPYSRLGALKKYVVPEASAFAIRRYDRGIFGRRHQEDFNQVFGKHPASDGREKYDSSYEQLGAVVSAILGAEGVEEFIRRLCFVVLSGNNDAHLKNWSLLYRDGIRAEFSPLYDQVSTVAWKRLDRRLALKLGGTREFSRITQDSFVHLGGKLGIVAAKTRRVLTGTLAAAADAWNEGGGWNMPPEHRAALSEHWQLVPLLKGTGFRPS